MKVSPRPNIPEWNHYSSVHDEQNNLNNFTRKPVHCLHREINLDLLLEVSQTRQMNHLTKRSFNKARSNVNIQCGKSLKNDAMTIVNGWYDRFRVQHVRNVWSTIFVRRSRSRWSFVFDSHAPIVRYAMPAAWKWEALRSIRGADIEKDIIEFSLCFMQIETLRRNVERHLLGKSFFFFVVFSLQLSSKNFHFTILSLAQTYQEIKKKKSKIQIPSERNSWAYQKFKLLK